MTPTLRALAVGGLATLAMGVWLLSPTPLAEVVDPAPHTTLATPATATLVEQGRYLATVGNCQGCHTPPGSPPYGGGVAIHTPFGAVYGSNLTPSPQGLGGWSPNDFWRAIHLGQSRDGRLLSPAFPYTHTTHITRTDSDALFAYLQSLAPVDTATPPHTVRWPYHTQAALKVWRALFFSPGTPPPVAPTEGPARGAYLVQGLAHCSACHTPRNRWGGTSDWLNLGGGLLPGQKGYAPSLLDSAEGGVQRWTLNDTVDFFRTGRNPQAWASGAMAEVVLHSTQHWSLADLQAMASHLRALPDTRPNTLPSVMPDATGTASTGTALYEQHCATCHGSQGEGGRLSDGSWAYPPLAGNRSVTSVSPANVVRSILYGGFGAATSAHPQPFGMPPFVTTLNNEEVAMLATHIRTQWGHQASPVTPLHVLQWRTGSTR